jgi:hypothetical protein
MLFKADCTVSAANRAADHQIIAGYSNKHSAFQNSRYMLYYLSAKLFVGQNSVKSVF